MTMLCNTSNTKHVETICRVNLLHSIINDLSVKQGTVPDYGSYVVPKATSHAEGTN